MPHSIHSIHGFSWESKLRYLYRLTERNKFSTTPYQLMANWTCVKCDPCHINLMTYTARCNNIQPNIYICCIKWLKLYIQTKSNETNKLTNKSCADRLEPQKTYSGAQRGTSVETGGSVYKCKIRFYLLVLRFFFLSELWRCWCYFTLYPLCEWHGWCCSTFDKVSP